MSSFTSSLQDRFAPNSVCFGCGPKNAQGLRIKSNPEESHVVSSWVPGPQHVAFSGFLSGGIISTLLDCHCNWTAAYALMEKSVARSPPATVTSELRVKFLEPTPLKPLLLRASPTEVAEHRVTVAGTLEVDGRATASATGVFVAVREGHPAFHRWE
ncbi:MAG TPA: PaaI family thioesterase [Nitrososphaerales archaeon]|nr:PaaI family thioesterase [Nitrososphaerales archaeon]